MAEPRRYQLQNERANRLIAELLDAADVPADRRGYIQPLLTTVLKLHEDGAGTGDLKITNTALKELRYAYKVFAPYIGDPEGDRLRLGARDARARKRRRARGSSAGG